MTTEEEIKFLKKYRKTKSGKIFSLFCDVLSMENQHQDFDKLSFMASALSIATKGTRMEAEAEQFIRHVCPKFFKENG